MQVNKGREKLKGEELANCRFPSSGRPGATVSSSTAGTPKAAEQHGAGGGGAAAAGAGAAACALMLMLLVLLQLMVLVAPVVVELVLVALASPTKHRS